MYLLEGFGWFKLSMTRRRQHSIGFVHENAALGDRIKAEGEEKEKNML